VPVVPAGLDVPGVKVTCPMEADAAVAKLPVMCKMYVEAREEAL